MIKRFNTSFVYSQLKSHGYYEFTIENKKIVIKEIKQDENSLINKLYQLIINNSIIINGGTISNIFNAIRTKIN